VPFYRVIQPYPLNHGFADMLFENFEKILVIEETMPVIEMQLAKRDQDLGQK